MRGRDAPGAVLGSNTLRNETATFSYLVAVVCVLRFPVERVLFEVGVHGAAYGRIEVFGAEAIE